MHILDKSVRVTAGAALFSLLMLLGEYGLCATLDSTSEIKRNKHEISATGPASMDDTGASVESLAIETQYPLVLTGGTAATEQQIHIKWRSVATLNFTSETIANPAPAHSIEPIRTGYLSWTVTFNGTQVLDSRTGLRANVSALTNSAVRPRDVVFDEKQGTVWFYGETVFRYRVGERTLEQLEPESGTFHTIRKAVASSSGLWLATESGIFLMQNGGRELKKIRHAEIDGATFINGVAVNDDVWLATTAARLVRLTPTSTRIDLAISKSLPGVPAEMMVANRSIWMLLSIGQTSRYQLAFADIGANQFGVMAGKYFSLREKDGHLLAGTSTSLFQIDPDRRTLAKLRLTEDGVLARAARKDSVLFVGSSYGYKDNCEIVEHGQIDVSKGWIDALSDLLSP